MRPLTCYPDLGAGAGFPFRLADCSLANLQDNPVGPFSNLKEGEGSGSGMAYPDIPQSMTLQEYALRLMMADNSLDRIVIGASTLQDFEHQTELIEKVSTSDSPLDAITTANELEHRKKKEETEIED